MDFCSKYHYDRSRRKTIDHFTEKLKEKRQTGQQQKQAFHAISLYHTILSSERAKIKALKSKTEGYSTKKDHFSKTKADWTPLYNYLDNKIKSRHYSPKTLAAYCLWVRQLQGNYDIRTIQELLGHSDVRTTMIYTHTIKGQPIKEAKSPLDIEPQDS